MMNNSLERYNTMDYVLDQLRAMLREGTGVEEAIQSLETESTIGRHNELLAMKQYAEAALGVTQPKCDRIMRRLNGEADETDIGEGC